MRATTATVRQPPSWPPLTHTMHSYSERDSRLDGWLPLTHNVLFIACTQTGSAMETVHVCMQSSSLYCKHADSGRHNRLAGRRSLTTCIHAVSGTAGWMAGCCSLTMCFALHAHMQAV